MPLPEAKAWLRQLPGIGPKSAGIILSFSLGMPAMAIDTHIFRVCQRLRTDRTQGHRGQSPRLDGRGGGGGPGIYPFHIGFITHGRQICKAQRPLCCLECVAGLCLPLPGGHFLSLTASTSSDNPAANPEAQGKRKSAPKPKTTSRSKTKSGPKTTPKGKTSPSSRVSVTQLPHSAPMPEDQR